LRIFQNAQVAEKAEILRARDAHNESILVGPAYVSLAPVSLEIGDTTAANHSAAPDWLAYMIFRLLVYQLLPVVK
jgi:hypothetical protein